MNTVTRTLAELDPEGGPSTDITAQDEDLLRAIMAVPIAEPAGKQRTHVRRTLVIGGLVAATVALGMTTVDIGSHEVGASPAAAAVLERAADIAIKTSDPVVGPGQYLRITTVERSWMSPMDLTKLGSDGKPLYYESLRTQHAWVPHDRDDTWVFDERSVVTDRVSTDAPTPGSVEEAHHTWTSRVVVQRIGTSTPSTRTPPGMPPCRVIPDGCSTSCSPAGPGMTHASTTRSLTWP